MNINIIGPTHYTGYAYTCLNIVKSLFKLGHNISLFPIGSVNAENQADANILKTCINNAKYFDANAPCIRIWHQYDMGLFVGKGKHIGFPFFELDRLNNLELHHLGSVDEIWVASEWAKDIVVRDLYNHYKWPNCASLVKVVPLGVDRTIFNETPNPIPKPATAPFIFLNAGKWEIRKGHDILGVAFNAAFKPTDHVELWMLPHNPFLSATEIADWEKMYMNSPMGRAGKIKIIPRQQSSADVAHIMRIADCGVFPYRAEGWNLEGLEMLSCGKPTIMTAYSAPLEYIRHKMVVDIDDANKWIGPVRGIPVSKMVPAFDGKWFFGQDGNWAEPDLQTLISEMKSQFNNKDNVEANAVEVAKRFTWERTADHIIGLI